MLKPKQSLFFIGLGAYLADGVAGGFYRRLYRGGVRLCLADDDSLALGVGGGDLLHGTGGVHSVAVSVPVKKAMKK